MKLDINKLHPIPKKIGISTFWLAVYSKPNKEIEEFINFHNLKVEESGKYTNILIWEDWNIFNLFKQPEQFAYMDGFSPNINKSLHAWHLANLVTAKAFQKLWITEKTIALMGDTLQWTNEKYLEEYFNLIHKFKYKLHNTYFASNMVYNWRLQAWNDKYEWTKVFNIDWNKIVWTKKDGSSSYFYQDAALAELLNKKTLYLTGSEQNQHFELLGKIFNIKHIWLWLLKLSGKKMSSRVWNVIMAKDLVKTELDYNIFAGHILKRNPKTEKIINLDELNNPTYSPWLYISYTMARLYSAGCEDEKWCSARLDYAYLKSKCNLNPSILFNELFSYCVSINSLYEKKRIKWNADNLILFSDMLGSLTTQCERLGLFKTKKV